MEAQEWCHRYKVSGNVRDLNQAWDLYYHVFRRISRQLPQLTSLELQYVSHKLLLCRDQELAVPGSYVPNQPVVRIAHIQSSLQVITSKQRPRKLCIRGKVCILCSIDSMPLLLISLLQSDSFLMLRNSYLGFNFCIHRQQWQGLHVPSEGPRGPASGRASDATLRPRKHVTSQRPGHIPQESHNPGELTSHIP